MRTVLAAVVIASTAVASAQPAPPSTPAQALAAVEQFYAKVTAFKASFRQTIKNATFGTTRTVGGTISFEAPDHYRFDYSDKTGVTKSIGFDGTTTWIVDHRTRTLIKQQGGSQPAPLRFLTGASALSSQYLVKIVGRASQGSQQSVVLHLTPLSPSAITKELRITIDPSDGHVVGTFVVDTSGSTDEFQFSAPDVQPRFPTGWFQPKP